MTKYVFRVYTTYDPEDARRATREYIWSGVHLIPHCGFLSGISVEGMKSESSAPTHHCWLKN